MAWTGYDEWLKKVKDSGMYYSDADLQYAANDQNFANASWQYKNDYMNATTPEARALANANMEALRRPYGYQGGSAGDRYDPIASAGSNIIPFSGTTGNWSGAMSESWGKLNDYPDWQHSEGYNDALGNVLDYGQFSYDYASDPIYDVYKQEYTREGRRAQEEALANAAIMTGGVPSSYAQTAAQQAGNYYTAQLADKIPELRNQAFNEYNQNFQNLLSKYNTAYTGDAFDYGVYGDKYNRLVNNFGLASGRYDTELGQANDAAAQLAALGDYSKYEGLYGGGYQDAYDKQKAQQDALAAAQAAAALGDYSLLDQYYNLDGTLANAYAAQQAAKLAGKGGSGGGTPDVPANPMPQSTFKMLYDKAIESPETAAGILKQYWNSLSDAQRNNLAHLAGMDSAELNALGGITGLGVSAVDDLLNAMAMNQEQEQIPTTISGLVQWLPMGLTRAQFDNRMLDNGVDSKQLDSAWLEYGQRVTDGAKGLSKEARALADRFLNEDRDNWKASVQSAYETGLLTKTDMDYLMQIAGY